MGLKTIVSRLTARREALRLKRSLRQEPDASTTNAVAGRAPNLLDVDVAASGFPQEVRRQDY